jgi:hypothetical protein
MMTDQVGTSSRRATHQRLCELGQHHRLLLVGRSRAPGPNARRLTCTARKSGPAGLIR